MSKFHLGRFWREFLIKNHDKIGFEMDEGYMENPERQLRIFTL